MLDIVDIMLDIVDKLVIFLNTQYLGTWGARLGGGSLSTGIPATSSSPMISLETRVSLGFYI